MEEATATMHDDAAAGAANAGGGRAAGAEQNFVLNILYASQQERLD